MNAASVQIQSSRLDFEFSRFGLIHRGIRVQTRRLKYRLCASDRLNFASSEGLRGSNPVAIFAADSVA
jgi:hypothetical protein